MSYFWPPFGHQNEVENRRRKSIDKKGGESFKVVLTRLGGEGGGPPGEGVRVGEEGR